MKEMRRSFPAFRAKRVVKIAVAALAASCAAGTVRVEPKDDGRILMNPGMGLTMHYYSNTSNYGNKIEPGDTLDWFPGCSAVYLRLPWSVLEPEEGFYNWSAIDTPAQRWIEKGLQIAFRITCSESWMEYATPKWVRDAGVGGTAYNMGHMRAGRTAWDPDFGDPIFLAKLEKFVAAFAARYDGRPEVAFIDIGTYGLWGEGHTHMSSKVPEAKRAVDLPKHIDLWTKYVKKTQLVISDDIDGHDNRSGNYPLLDYARSKGVGWRDDSILVNKRHPWYHADQAARYWRTSPIVLEHEHWRGRDTPGQKALLLKAVEDHHASWMSIHGDPHDIRKDASAEFDALSLRIGYRFRAKEVEYPSEVTVGANAQKFPVSFTFANAGVAPCYADAFPCLTVKDPKGAILAVMADGDFNLRALLPAATADEAEAKSHTAFFRLGAGNYPVTPCGTFDVYLSVGRVDGTPVYELPLGDSDGHRRYRIGQISFK
ncbi:MAG: DUF4832 domain-containing protein [Kiritimatiellae bacterium]|nr:DUF4832 domain-containing protein [Kiritimatiellia bacterium]